MKIDRTKMLILSGLGLCVLVMVGWCFYIYSSKKQPKEADNTNLSLDVDTKYTYADMAKHNAEKGDQGDDYQYRNTPTIADNSTETNTNTMPGEDRYAKEKQQIKNVVHNIQNQDLDYKAQESTSDITTKSTIRKPNSTGGVVSYNSNNISEYTQEQKPENTPKAPNRGKLFNDSSDEAASVNINNEIAVPAVIHGEQAIRDGSSVKMRTTQDCTIEGTLVPKNTFLFGQVRISENRININIGGFRVNGTIVSTPLNAYDQDGSLGLMLIGGNGEGVTDKAVDIADASTGNVLSNVPVIGGVAQATKDIFRTRQTKSKQVVLASNYKLILKRS